MKTYICFPNGKAKALTMSYDDGTKHDIRLIDIFNKNGIKGTFNLNYGFIMEKAKGSHRPRLGPEVVKTLYEGHEIATHTYSHPTISRCPMTDVAREILSDREGLEKLTGRIIRGHAYPNGSYSEEIKQLFSSLGIAYARVTKTDTSFELPTDPMEWRATCHHTDPKLMEYAKFFAEFKKAQYLKLMYVWGHSYEFNEQDNWEVIEEFCEYMGGRDDIWYATNIEIIDYMDAARRLVFSADCRSAYNPSAISVFLDINDGERIVEVLPGSTASLK